MYLYDICSLILIILNKLRDQIKENELAKTHPPYRSPNHSGPQFLQSIYTHRHLKFLTYLMVHKRKLKKHENPTHRVYTT